MLFEAIEIEKKAKQDEECQSSGSQAQKKKTDKSERPAKNHKNQKKEKYVNIKREKLLQEDPDPDLAKNVPTQPK